MWRGCRPTLATLSTYVVGRKTSRSRGSERSSPATGHTDLCSVQLKDLVCFRKRLLFYLPVIAMMIGWWSVYTHFALRPVDGPLHNSTQEQVPHPYLENIKYFQPIMSFACGTVVLVLNNYTQAVNTLRYAYYALLFATVFIGVVVYAALMFVFAPDHPAIVLFGTMLAAGSTASLSLIASAKTKYFYELRKARGEDGPPMAGPPMAGPPMAGPPMAGPPMAGPPMEGPP